MKIKTIDRFKLPEGLKVRYFGGLLYRVTGHLERKIVKNIPINKLSLNQKYREEKIIVSLTTYPARINSVGYVIKTLFNQSVKPDRIVLWLAKSQFENFEFPEIIKDLVEKGLEIRCCEDLRSHKKYHYVLQEQNPNEIVITYDDDLIYPEDSIERLLEMHKKYPNYIICNRGGNCKQTNGEFLPYKKWKLFSKEGVRTPTMKIFPSTGAGTLYPYNSVNKEAFNIEKMKKIAYTADDLWMRYMSVLNGTKVVKTRLCNKTLTCFEVNQKEGLANYNCLEGGNDFTIKLLNENYPDVFKEIFKDELFN